MRLWCLAVYALAGQAAVLERMGESKDVDWWLQSFLITGLKTDVERPAWSHPIAAGHGMAGMSTAPQQTWLCQMRSTAPCPLGFASSETRSCRPGPQMGGSAQIKAQLVPPWGS